MPPQQQQHQQQQQQQQHQQQNGTASYVDPRHASIDQRLNRITQMGGWAANNEPDQPKAKLGDKLLQRQNEKYMNRLEGNPPINIQMPLPQATNTIPMDQRMLLLQPSGREMKTLPASKIPKIKTVQPVAPSAPAGRPAAAHTVKPAKRITPLAPVASVAPVAPVARVDAPGSPEYIQKLDHAARMFFQKADVDGGGTISSLEFAKTLKIQGKTFAKKGHSRGKSWFNAPMGLYQKIDTDGDGQIDIHEFVEFV